MRNCSWKDCKRSSSMATNTTCMPPTGLVSRIDTGIPHLPGTQLHTGSPT